MKYYNWLSTIGMSVYFLLSLINRTKATYGYYQKSKQCDKKRKSLNIKVVFIVSRSSKYKNKKN